MTATVHPTTDPQPSVSDVATPLPCPFCGTHPESKSFPVGPAEVNETVHQIKCLNRRCPAEPFVVEGTEAEAITAWNTRH